MIYEYEYDNINQEYNYTIGTYASIPIKADGSTNDFNSLRDILIRINILGGGTLILPPSKTIFIDPDLDPNNQETGIAIFSNMTIKSSGGNTTIKGGSNITTLFAVAAKENVSIENLIFQGGSITTAGIGIFSDDVNLRNKNITIKECTFKDITFTDDPKKSPSLITAVNIDNLVIKNCSFSKGALGVSVSKLNNHVYLRDNIFEKSLTNNPIRISGSSELGECTKNLWITGNHMEIGRAASEIENTVITRLEDGRAFLNGYDVFAKPIGNSAINITCEETETVQLHHENVIIENNIAEGPDFGFFDGGSGDLYSLKDVERLTCTGNRARNSGDLGFAIERCHFAIVSNNTADRNNSCGISIFDSTNVNVIGNVCRDNELTRDGLYATNPYGGIRVEGDSFNVLVEGNFFFATSGVKRSLVNSLATGSQNNQYNTPGVPTQQYGVVVQQSGESGSADNTSGIEGAYQKTPFNVKIGHNHTSTHFWGTVYNKMKATQIVDTYSSHTFPLKADYPLGARLRNNLTFASTSATKEWYVSHRIELFVKKDVNLINDPNNIIEVAVRTGIPGNQMSFLDENGQNSNFKYIINDDLTTIQQDDIIGVMLDDYSVHWTKISAVTVDGNTATITLQDDLPDNVSIRFKDPDENIVDIERENRIVKRVVSLRWEPLI